MLGQPERTNLSFGLVDFLMTVLKLEELGPKVSIKIYLESLSSTSEENCFSCGFWTRF